MKFLVLIVNKFLLWLSRTASPLTAIPSCVICSPAPYLPWQPWAHRKNGIPGANWTLSSRIWVGNATDDKENCAHHIFEQQMASHPRWKLSHCFMRQLRVTAITQFMPFLQSILQLNLTSRRVKGFCGDPKYLVLCLSYLVSYGRINIYF